MHTYAYSAFVSMPTTFPYCLLLCALLFCLTATTASRPLLQPQGRKEGAVPYLVEACVKRLCKFGIGEQTPFPQEREGGGGTPISPPLSRFPSLSDLFLDSPPFLPRCSAPPHLSSLCVSACTMQMRWAFSASQAASPMSERCASASVKVWSHAATTVRRDA